MLVIGTALAVQPFNMLVGKGQPDTLQVLINRENNAWSGFDFEKGGPNRLFLKGDCDDVITKLAKDIGWDEDLNKLIAECPTSKIQKL